MLAELRDLVVSCDAPYLPPMAILARQFGVSIKTVSAAASLLRREGILDYSNGRRMRITGRSLSEVSFGAEPREPVVDGVVRRIKDEIACGNFRVGRMLPKIRALVSQFGVSDRTITRALRLLVAESLVHRRGRQYVVGPSVVSGSAQRHTSTRVILLLIPDRHGWRVLGGQQRTARFCSTVNECSEQQQIRLASVLTEESRSSALLGLDAGMERARELVKELDTRYIGALIAGASSRILPFEEWVRLLTSLGQPVVWFDQYDERRNRLLGVHHPGLYRCHFSEKAALECALDHLAAAGHRRIAYASQHGYGEPWRGRRGEQLKQMGKSRQEPLDIKTYPSLVDLVRRTRPEAIVAPIAALIAKRAPIVETFEYFLERFDALTPAIRAFGEEGSDQSPSYRIALVSRFLARGGGRLAGSLSDNDGDTPRVRKKKRLLRSLTRLELDGRHTYLASMLPYMLHVLRAGQTTALLCTCDAEAVVLYQFLKSADLHIPRDISVLSFDNSSSLHPYPIDSVDFGFGHLGYCAVHAITRDIPVKKDKLGNIAPQPHVVQRGSVGVAPGVFHP